MVGIFAKIVKLISVWVVLKRSNQSLFHSMQQINHRCDIKKRTLFFEIYGNKTKKIHEKIQEEREEISFYIDR